MNYVDYTVFTFIYRIYVTSHDHGTNQIIPGVVWDMKSSIMSLFRFVFATTLIVHITVILLYKDYGNSCFTPSNVPWHSNLTASKSMESVKRSFIRRSETSKNASDTQYFLLMLVMSTANSVGLKRREGIRRSWMKGYKEKTPRILIMFSMGTGNISPFEMKELKNEQSHYGDLLLLTDLHDHYSNLTRKVLVSLVEVDNNYKFSYFMKCDDDVFIALDKLVSELEESFTTKSLYWGYFNTNGWIFNTRDWIRRMGKNSEKNWFLCSTYLPYASGPGYILSFDLVKRITSNADGLMMYQNEDVSMGVWLSPYTMERYHDQRFYVHTSEHPNSINCQQHLLVHLSDSRGNAMMIRQKSLALRRSVCTEEEEHHQKSTPFLILFCVASLTLFSVCLVLYVRKMKL